MKCPPHQASQARNRSGAALPIILVLIALFTTLSQSLAMLVVIQHRQAFHRMDQSQAIRLAEAGVLRATAALERNSEWSGEDWTPRLLNGASATVNLRRRTSRGTLSVEAEASLTTRSGRIHKSLQTLDVVAASAMDLGKNTTP